ncbi:Six-hairpin glycosidase-like protein [Myxozyma melibiosi]|uniref:Six-hairpin glycosidase-like protein n=1 Tax=Myxozyma melibiosi TaxID=54550 RepID=A0ABR1F1N6_9ASCO
MPATVNGVHSEEVHRTIKLLIKNLVEIKDTTGEFLLTLPDGRVIDTKGWQDWEWTHGIGLYGMWHYYTLTADSDVLATITDWFTRRFAEGTTTKNVNTFAPFLTLAYMYETPATSNPTYLGYLDAWAEWAMYDLERTPYGGIQHVTYLTTNHNQLWDDTLMMSVMPLAKIGLVLNRPEYVNEAKRQFLTHIKYLFDRSSGLFFHGWTFDDGGHNFANARWARGNSWITIVIPEFIELVDLAEGDFLRTYLIETLEAQVAALAQTQDSETGLWHTLLDDPTAYLEASATAGFAYGILKAIRKRYISNKYLPVAHKAIAGVLANVSSDGELLQTSFGTGMGDSLQFYKDIKLTSMPYGQAMAMMALTEYLRVYI